LRERLDDIEALAEALLEDIVRRAGMASRSLAPDALELLMQQDWPGNIRELRNVLELACLMGDEMLLQAAQLAPYLKPATGATGTAGRNVALAGSELRPVPALPAPRVIGPDDASLLRPLAEQIAELERSALRAALRATGGNKFAAAKLLCMSRASLYDKLPLLTQE
jgi:DNA-binding NtrC family response regulator